jgi:hypothetical protein
MRLPGRSCGSVVNLHPDFAPHRAGRHHVLSNICTIKSTLIHDNIKTAVQQKSILKPPILHFRAPARPELAGAVMVMLPILLSVPFPAAQKQMHRSINWPLLLSQDSRPSSLRTRTPLLLVPLLECDRTCMVSSDVVKVFDLVDPDDPVLARERLF